MSGTCPGATSPGTITQLQLRGGADIYLNDRVRSKSMFWKKYKRHTPYASEPVQQPFTGTVTYGSDSQITFSRTGDLLHHQYLVIDVPGIRVVPNPNNMNGMFPACNACDATEDGIPALPSCTFISSVPEEDDTSFLDDAEICSGVAGPWAHYINAFAQFVAGKVCFVVGSFAIDNHWAEYNFAWEELTGKSGKLLTEMIGKRTTRSQLIEDSQYPQRFYLPLNFFYTQHLGNTFPAVSAIFMQYGLTVCFADLRKMIQVSDSSLTVVRADTCQPLANTDIKCHVDSQYYFLGECERMKYAKGCFELLIDQVQTFHTDHRGPHLLVRVNFNNPISEFIWMFRREKNKNCNNLSNFSGKFGRDPYRTVHLRINNGNRFSSRNAQYFRLVQPWQHHTRIPNSHIYCFSFAEKPEKRKPTGTINASRIESMEFSFEIQECLRDENLEFFLFGRSKNVFSFSKGMASLRFQY